MSEMASSIHAAGVSCTRLRLHACTWELHAYSGKGRKLHAYIIRMCVCVLGVPAEGVLVRGRYSVRGGVRRGVLGTAVQRRAD